MAHGSIILWIRSKRQSETSTRVKYERRKTDMKLFQYLRDGGLYGGYLLCLLVLVILGANGLAMIFG